MWVNLWVNLGQEKLILWKQPAQVQDEKNASLFRQQLVKRGKIGQENIEESKTLNKISMKPRTNVKFKKKSAYLLCCIPSL